MIIKIGETRMVGIQVISKLDEEFEILSASAELIDNSGTIVDTPNVLIDNTTHKLTAVVTPSKICKYQLKFKYTIALEVLIAPVTIEVRE